MSFNEKHILLTFDVEDWFQVENFKQCIPFSSWKDRPFRFEDNTYLILDLLDQFNVKATFFVLGWNAQCAPKLIHDIHTRGHEVASHGYYHNLCHLQSGCALRDDLLNSKKILEDAIGSPVYGYRAPSFSINEKILKVIEECGFLYDSSFNSFGTHSRYGHIDLSRNGKNGVAFQVSENFYELPISNMKLGKYIFPWGGGGYFRLIPSPLFRWGVRSILKKETGYIFYLHPWEIDPEQPKVQKAPILYKFRHYTNLDKSLMKLSSFLETFRKYQFVTCHQYLQRQRTPVK
jgi:polysaccharide deacetylase family protein (PEP-CTERM system associated)